MGDGLTITGGANGLAARFDDLHAQANLLDALASDLGEVATTLAHVSLSPDIAEAAVLCPIEAARAEEVLLAANLGPGGAGVAWARAEASVAFLRLSISAYQEVDEVLARVSDEASFVGGFALGSLTAPMVAAGALSSPILGTALWANRDALMDEVQELSYDEPWTQEIAARAAPGFVEGVVSSVLGGSPLLLGLLSGGHWPTSDLQEAMNGLLRVVGPAGVLEDSGSFSVRAQGPPKQVDFGQPHFVAEVMRHHGALSKQEAAIQIVTVDGPSGPAYVVQIPGTQVWSPSRGGNPIDLTTNVHLVAGHRTQLGEAVIEAMRAARIPADAPVMLTGHSQGGMVAATIAADPRHRDEFNVRAVLTAGSPIGHTPVPAAIAVLSLEQEQDLVPKLDGADNPDRPNWVTVSRDLNQGTPVNPARSVVAAHSLANYRQTGSAIDGSDDPAVFRWRAINTEFFGPGSAQRYRIDPVGGR